MIDTLKELQRTAQVAGERAFRLLWDMMALASDRIRAASGAEPPPAPLPGMSVRPEPPPPTPQSTPTRAAKPKATRAKRAGAGTKRKATGGRADQLLRVMQILAEADGAWMSAKEICDAGAEAGTPILPGNVRKVIRGRGERFIETRSRTGSRRGALEYNLTRAGREHLK